MVSLDERLYEPISVCPDLKYVSLIMIVFKVFCHLLYSMNQESCVEMQDGFMSRMN